MKNMTPDKYKNINLEFIYEMADGEDEFVTEIITSYLTSIPLTIAKLQDATQAGNAEDITYLGHKLKGSFRFIGANELGDMAERMETNAQSNIDMENMVAMAAQIADVATLAQKDLEEVLANINS